MASAGAQCDHVTHVSTQLPYAILAAAVSFVTYIVAGFVKTAWIALPVGIVLMLIAYRRGQRAYDDAFSMIHHAVRDVAAWVRG